MKISDIILEAPLGSYDIVGDLADRGSFRAPDRAIITSQKTPARLQHAFRNTREIVDLVFLPLKGPVSDVIAAGEQYGGIWTREVAHKRLPRRTLPEPSSPDAIMVVLTHNEGANRLPLSPWIIAHRIGHAIYFSPDGAHGEPLLHDR